jgi:hypothetical protein
MADKKIYISMRGMVQSLNLSVTAAIMLFEVNRQRAALKKDWRLGAEERERLEASFNTRR